MTFTSTISGVGVQSVSIALKDDVDIKNKYNEGADPSLCNDDVNNRIKIDLYKNGVAIILYTSSTSVMMKHPGMERNQVNRKSVLFTPVVQRTTSAVTVYCVTTGMI